MLSRVGIFKPCPNLLELGMFEFRCYVTLFHLHPHIHFFFHYLEKKINNFTLFFFNKYNIKYKILKNI